MPGSQGFPAPRFRSAVPEPQACYLLPAPRRSASAHARVRGQRRRRLWPPCSQNSDRCGLPPCRKPWRSSRCWRDGNRIREHSSPQHRGSGCGALVTANQPVALTTVQQLDPIYVDLTQSSVELLRLKRDLADGRLQHVAEQVVPVRLLLEDGSEYAASGQLAFSGVSVDTDTGSVTLRAVFPNPQAELLPGMYVRARLAQGEIEKAILVPHAALTHDRRGNAIVMVVGTGDKVEARPVTAIRSIGDKWLVSEGLLAGDRIVVDGLQKIRPGAPVTVQEAGTGAAAAK
ncbi:MAG: efflux RND transporter periplasmic adaptor subunit [Candidatus Accumulibacter sp.]|nr:efflux RND transporter periplasmic adaptor subunit [Accumulibacter sp.]